MRVLETELLKRFARTCHEGWKQGWHERNGGNMADARASVRESFSIKVIK